MAASPVSDKKAVIRPVDLYGHVESWWGESFDDKLIERILAAPKDHLRAFSESLEDLRGGFVESLPEIPPGVLRPTLAPYTVPFYSTNIEDALPLLLYAHEIVLDKDFLFDSVDPAQLDVIDEEPLYGESIDQRKRLSMDLRQAARIRPLVEDGSIKFASIVARARGVREATTDDALVEYFMRVPEVVEFLRWLIFPSGLENRVRAFIDISFFGIVAACDLAAARRAQLLAGSQLEQIVIRSLLEGPVVDNRQVGLQKLASLKVPKMKGDISALVALRKSDADFAEWRTLLGEALTYVGELSDEASLEEAAEIVYAQLSDGLSQVNKAVKKSPALQALKGGLSGLMVSSISAATTGVMTGNPWTALASGAAAKVADAGVTYVKALQARRKGRLILDVSMMFDPHEQP